MTKRSSSTASLVGAALVGGCVVYASAPSSTVDAGSDAAVTALFPGPDAPSPPTRHFFVTSQVYRGNLPVAVSGLGGLLAADQICTDSARGAGLAGRYKALVSSDEVDAIARIEDVGPWYSADGKTMLFRNKASLASRPEVPPNLDERGRPVDVSGGVVWTGSTTAGRKIPGSTCGGWTKEAGYAAYGDPSNVAAWQQSGHEVCSRDARFYCLEQ